MNKYILLLWVIIIIGVIVALSTSCFIREPESWALNAESKIATSKAFPDQFGGLTITDSSVYLSLENGMLYRLDHEGNTLWSFGMQDYSIYPPIEHESTTYVTSFDGRLYALDTRTGGEQWRFTTPNLVMADTEPVISGAIVLFGSRNGTLYALDKNTGEIKWTFQTRSIDITQITFDEPVIHFGQFTADQTLVYLNSATDNSLYALDLLTGTIKWSLKNYGFFYQKPILQENSVSLQNNKGMLLTINKKVGHIISETILNPSQSDMPKFTDATIDAKTSRRLGDAVYALTKDHIYLVKLDRQQVNTNISILTKKVLKNKPYISRRTKQSQAITIHPQEPKAEKNTIYTLTITHDDSVYTNPQKDISIQAKFTSPQKIQYTVFGFYYDNNTWQARFTPNQTGTWHWSVGEIRGSFEVIDSTYPEFMRISATQPKMFTTGNAVVVPLGLQDCVKDYNQNGDPLDQWFPGVTYQPSFNPKTISSFSMDAYLSLYQKAGFNLWRWGVNNCSYPLWRELSPRGNRYALNEGLRTDTLFDALRAHGYHVWMSLFSYNLPLSNNLSVRDKQSILKDYLSYVVARYAAHVDVWELGNEIDLDNKTLAFMSSYIRLIDPYKHPITTNWERPNDAAIEINSLHWYDNKCDDFCDRDLKLEITKYTPLSKPTVFSEQGNQEANWDDHSADRMRVRLWIGFMEQISFIFWNSSQAYYTGAFGASNIYLGPTERMYTSVFNNLIRVLGASTKAIQVASLSDGVKIFGQTSDDTALIYIYRRIHNPEFKPAYIQIYASAQGMGNWINPQTGSVMRSEPLRAGDQTLISPPFGTDALLSVTYSN